MSSFLLVLDLINDLVSADGPNGGQPLGQEIVRRKVLANSAVAISKARAAGTAVVYVRVGFNPGDREKPRCSPLLSGLHAAGLIALDHNGTAVHPAVAPEPGDLDLIKHRVSPFYGTDLDLLIRAHGVSKLYLLGVSTSYAVSAAVREAHDRDLNLVLIEDCCAAGSQEEHDAEIDILRGLCGEVTTSDAVTFDRPAH